MGAPGPECPWRHPPFGNPCGARVPACSGNGPERTFRSVVPGNGPRSLTILGESRTSLANCCTGLGSCCTSFGSCCASLGSCCTSLSSCCTGPGPCCTGLGKCCTGLVPCCTSLGPCCTSLSSCCTSLGSCCTGLGSCCTGLGSCCRGLGSCCTGFGPHPMLSHTPTTRSPCFIRHLGPLVLGMAAVVPGLWLLGFRGLKAFALRGWNLCALVNWYVALGGCCRWPLAVGPNTVAAHPT